MVFGTMNDPSGAVRQMPPSPPACTSDYAPSHLSAQTSSGVSQTSGTRASSRSDPGYNTESGPGLVSSSASSTGQTVRGLSQVPQQSQSITQGLPLGQRSVGVTSTPDPTTSRHLSTVFTSQDIVPRAPSISSITVPHYPEQRMAAQVLPNPHSQIFPRQEGLSGDMPGFMNSFIGMEDYSLSSNPLSFMGHPSPFLPSHPSDSSYRPVSQSPRPSVSGSFPHERTPIRHHSVVANRTRSPSRPDLLLAYATEQNQGQQPSLMSTSSIAPSHHRSTSTSMQDVASYPQTLGIGPYVDPNSFLMGASGNQGHSLTSEMSYSTTMDMPGFFATQIPMGHSSMLPGSTFSSHESSYPGENMMVHGSPGHHGSPDPSLNSPFPPIPMQLESTQDETDSSASRPRPQCWDHGCNGRQFSTFSNLLRHQREKSGNATKAVCPHCGTEFTRTTARNGHLYGGKCKVLQEKEAALEKESADRTSG